MLGHLLNSTLNKWTIVQITAVVQTKKYDDDEKTCKIIPKTVHQGKIGTEIEIHLSIKNSTKIITLSI
jgi:hypothetical protein